MQLLCKKKINISKQNSNSSFVIYVGIINFTELSVV